MNRSFVGGIYNDKGTPKKNNFAKKDFRITKRLKSAKSQNTRMQGVIPSKTA